VFGDSWFSAKAIWVACFSIKFFCIALIGLGGCLIDTFEPSQTLMKIFIERQTDLGREGPIGRKGKNPHH